MNVMQPIPAETANAADPQAEISARLERLPITREVFWARNIVGAATFFDGYTVIAIAYAIRPRPRVGPDSLSDRHDPVDGLSGTVDRCDPVWLACREGRPAESSSVHDPALRQHGCRMPVRCPGRHDDGLPFRRGIGTGGEVPVASAYINELIGSKGRGKFFLLYEVMFLLGLVGAGLIGYFMVPVYGWKAMFVVGLVPAIVMIPLRWFLKESPRWLAANGRYSEANAIVTRMEESARAAGKELPEPKLIHAPIHRKSDWRELFQGIYLKRTLSIWAMWFTAYTVANGTITAADPVSTGLQPAASNQHLLWFPDVGRRRDRRRHLRAAHRQSGTQALVHRCTASRSHAAAGSRMARRDLSHPGSGSCRSRLCDCPDRHILPVPVLGRDLPDTPQGTGNRNRQRLASLGIIGRPDPRRHGDVFHGHPVCLCELRSHSDRRCDHHGVVCGRNQGSRAGGAFSVTVENAI